MRSSDRAVEPAGSGTSVRDRSEQGTASLPVKPLAVWIESDQTDRVPLEHVHLKCAALEYEEHAQLKDLDRVHALLRHERDLVPGNPLVREHDIPVLLHVHD